MTVGTMGTTAGATDSALDSYTPVGGAGAFVGILLGESQPGRRRWRPVQHARVRAAGGIRGRAHGRPNSGVPGQKDPWPADDAGRQLRAHHPDGHTGVRAASRWWSVRAPRPSQPGFPRLERGHLCLRVGGQQQRLRLRRPVGQHDWYNTLLGLAMLVGRFVPIVLALAIAGSLAGARVHARTRATLDTTGPTFVAFLARRHPDRRRPHLPAHAHTRARSANASWDEWVDACRTPPLREV
jgi:hypothetical protein